MKHPKEFQAILKSNVDVTFDELCHVFAIATVIMTNLHKGMYDLDDEGVDSLADVLHTYDAIVCTILEKKKKGEIIDENDII